MRLPIVALWLLVVFLTPQSNQAHPSAGPGEVFKYELRARERPDAPQLIGVSQHSVEIVDGVTRERVEWVSLTKSSGEDLTRDARRVAPYFLSLDPRAAVKLQKPADNPAMMGMVTDLFTFYFAVSAAAGVTHLIRPGDEYRRPELIEGDFSDGQEFLVGRDVLRVSTKLVEATRATRVYETTMDAPPDARLKPLRDWMSASPCETPVNFQMVRPQGPQFIAAWGCERLTVTATVDVDTGRIDHATMVNPLLLRMRICRDAALEFCVDGPPMNRERAVSLTRIGV